VQELDSSLAIGSQIGDYRIIDILGAGGFGITYKAEDTVMHRLVALKEFLPQELAGRSNDASTVIPKTNCSDDYQYGLDKFLDEARTLAKFNHPNIVKAYTLVQANGTAYLVMEYVEGEALDEHLKKIHFSGNMAESRIREIIEPVLKGLAEVHKAGLLHRDIKPGNIYLQSGGDGQNNPMLIDFGAARQSVGEKSKSISAIISQGYAPPEQYTTRGKQGPFTDVYAIGAVMYYLVTGEKPIESTDRQHEIMGGEIDPLPPISSDEYTEAFIQAVIQSMVLVAKKRCQNVDQLQRILLGQGGETLQNQNSVNEDATRVIANNNSVKKPTEEKNIASDNNHQPSSPEGQSSSKKFIIIALVLMVAIGGYFGFTEYQNEQNRVKEQKKQASIALQKKQRLEIEKNDRLAKEKKEQKEAESKRLSEEKNIIATAQLGLQELGFQSPTHGKLDVRTQKAIEAFETKQGLLVTGALDEVFLEELEKSLTKQRAELLAIKKAKEKAAKLAKDKALAEQKAAKKLASELALKKKQEQDRLAAIEASKVNINVTVKPSDATILIEQKGVLFDNQSRILPGDYQVTLKRDGYKTQSHIIELSKNNYELNYQLKEYDYSSMELPVLRKGEQWKYTMGGKTSGQTVSTVIGESTYKGKAAYVLEGEAVLPIPESLRNENGYKALSKTSKINTDNNTYRSRTRTLMDKNSFEALKLEMSYGSTNSNDMDLNGEIVKGKKWPMKIGNKWETMSSNMRTYSEVVGAELVKVPAGEFYSFKVLNRTDGGSFVMDMTTWFSPEVKFMVKYEIKTSYNDKSLNLPDTTTTTELTDFTIK
jgi:serine/threonine protein kinase